MSIKSAIVRSMIRFLWGRYPHQVRDILADEGKHIHGNPFSKTPRVKPTTTDGIQVHRYPLDAVGTSHTARMAQGGDR